MLAGLVQTCWSRCCHVLTAGGATVRLKPIGKLPNSLRTPFQGKSACKPLEIWLTHYELNSGSGLPGLAPTVRAEPASTMDNCVLE